MTGAHYTQGPWIWWDEATSRPKNYDLMRLQSPTGRRIVSGYGGAGLNALGKTEEDRANARLIMASPDLLEALEEARTGLLWYRDTFPGVVDGSDDEAMERIEAAITKATGIAP
jgi:hypothetical protein